MASITLTVSDRLTKKERIEVAAQRLSYMSQAIQFLFLHPRGGLKSAVKAHFSGNAVILTVPD